MGQPIARNDLGTLNRTYTIPIVFLPGVMGTRLHFTAGGGDPEMFWDPDNVPRMEQWDTWPVGNGDMSPEEKAARIHFSRTAEVMDSRTSSSYERDPGTDTQLTADQIERGWSGVIGSFYHAFLVDLQRRMDEWFGERGVDCPVYAVGYDWRQSNVDSGAYVAGTIQAELPDADGLILVTHSLGGIVARAAMSANPDFAAMVLRVIHVAQPAGGAPVIYRRCMTGCEMPEDGKTQTDIFLGRFMGYERANFLRMFAALRSSGELLPNSRYLYAQTEWGTWAGWQDGAEWRSSIDIAADPFDVYADAACPLSILFGAPDGLREALRERIDEGRRFNQAGGPGRYAHGDTWTLYSTGLDTDVAFAYDERKKLSRRIKIRATQGDGTVPTASALALRLAKERNVEFTGAEHSTIMGVAAVQESIFGLIQARLEDLDSELPPSVPAGPDEPASDEWLWHRIQPGEYLSLIARDHGFSSWNDLYYWDAGLGGGFENWNYIPSAPNEDKYPGYPTDPDLIYPDQRVRVPKEHRCEHCEAA